MQFIKHMVENLFITATGVAALIHSTWALGTLFSGEQPDPVLNPVSFAGWFIPALLMAIALDIGQIYTSSEIRHGDRRAIKYVTFAIFAVATYYLQWLYMAHHIGSLELGTGVRSEWQGTVTLMRDMSIWILPLLFPLATMSYTMSQKDDPIEGIEIEVTTPLNDNPSLPKNIDDVDIDELEWDEVEQHLEFLYGGDGLQETEPYAPIDNTNAHHELTCPDCGWSTGPKLRLESAERSLRTHQARHCEAVQLEVE